MSFTHNCSPLLRHTYCMSPGPKYQGSSSPFGPIKSAPTQLLYSDFKQSNNVNISFILFILYFIPFPFCYFIYVNQPRGHLCKTKISPGQLGQGQGQGQGHRGQLPPTTPLEPPMESLHENGTAATFRSQVRHSRRYSPLQIRYIQRNCSDMKQSSNREGA